MSSVKIANVMPEAMAIIQIDKVNHKNYKELINKVIERAPDDLKRDSRTGSPLYHICSNKDQNIFKNFQELSELKKEIINGASSYINKTGYLSNDLVVTDAWLNVGKKGAILQWHNHSNSYISGTYYVNFDPNQHSLLGFKNDRITSTFNRPGISIPINEKMQTAYNLPIFQVGVPEGNILLWRSHLIHGYEIPNKSDNRVTLSFNIMPRECTDGKIFSFEILSD